MLTQRAANIAFAILVLIACAGFAWLAQGFEAAGLLASSGLPSRFFPQAVLGFTAFCALGVLVAYTVRGHAGDDEGKLVFAHRSEALRGLLTMVVAILCLVVWTRWGFVPMAVVMGPVCALAMGVRTPAVYVILPGLTAIVYLVFTQVLGIQLR